MSYTGSKAQAGRGSSLFIGGLTGSSAPITTLIGEVKTAGISGSQWDMEDVSNFQSGAQKEKLATMQDPGQLDLAGSRISGDAGQVAVEAAYATGLKYDFKLVLPINTQAGQTTAGDQYVFSAFVRSRDIPVDTTKAIAWNVKLEISGTPAYTQGN